MLNGFDRMTEVFQEYFAPSLRKRIQTLKSRLNKAYYETELMKEELSIAGTPIFPANNAGSQSTGTVDMTKFNRVTFLCGIGAIGTGSNTVFYLQQSANSNGAGPSNVATDNGTGNTATISGANQEATIECRADQLTARYALCLAIVTGANGASDYCIPIAGEPRNHPQSSDDNSVITRVYV